MSPRYSRPFTPMGAPSAAALMCHERTWEEGEPLISIPSARARTVATGPRAVSAWPLAWAMRRPLAQVSRHVATSNNRPTRTMPPSGSRRGLRDRGGSCPHGQAQGYQEGKPTKQEGNSLGRQPDARGAWTKGPGRRQASVRRPPNGGRRGIRRARRGQRRGRRTAMGMQQVNHSDVGMGHDPCPPCGGHPSGVRVPVASSAPGAIPAPGHPREDLPPAPTKPSPPVPARHRPHGTGREEA